MVPYLEQLLLLLKREPHSVKELLRKVCKKFEREHEPRPVVTRVQVAHLDEQKIQEPVQWSLLCGPVREVLPPEWAWAEWIIISQQEPRRRVIDLVRRIEE